MTNLHDPSYPMNPSNEDLACMEDKRLNRLGIDPDSDPASIMIELNRRQMAVQEKMKTESFRDEERAELIRWGIDPDADREQVKRLLNERSAQLRKADKEP